MKIIKYFTVLLSLFFSLGLMAQTENSAKGDSLIWYTDLMKAKDISAQTGKPIFAYFTGSDWCVWCIKLEKEVFAKKEFIEWAKKNVVLLELDFPKKKELSPELKKQNEDLEKQFQVKGVPTIWFFFLSAKKKKKQWVYKTLGTCGYPHGAIPGKEQIKFLENANAVLTHPSGSH